MIKFEKHDGLIFKMLDKPVPLTADAEMPCLVRLIQDDSPMGRLNKRNYDESLNKIECATGYNKMLKMSFNNMPFAIEKFEIIGTFVKEGSAEWAFGWQICEEPQPAKEPIANCENCKHVCTNSNIDHCQMYEPKPESENIIHGHIPADMHLEYFHLCKFKVGDWVEWCGGQYMVESAPPQSGGRYDIRSPYDELGCSVYPENITRKLDPSEVVIRIGCLSGTIAKSCDPNYFLMLHSRPITDCNHSMIRFSALDTETRELVESLLEAQMRGDIK